MEGGIKPKHIIAGIIWNFLMFLVLAKMSYYKPAPVFSMAGPVGVTYLSRGVNFSPPPDKQAVEEMPEPLEDVPEAITIPESILMTDVAPEENSPELPVLEPPKLRHKVQVKRQIVHAKVAVRKQRSRAVSSAMGNGSNRGASTSGSGGRGSGGSALGLAEVDEPPRILHKVEPPYPLRARRLQIEGQVVVQFVVNKQGSVQNLKVLSANPKGFFEKSVLNSLKKWTFRPGKYRGRPVDTVVILPVKFRLKD